MSKKIIGVLQARMTSSRLPGKVLLPILGRPMIEMQIERLRRAESLHNIVVATSDDPSDDPLAKTCQKINIDCFRGSLDDVLDRVYQAALPYLPSYVVRLTGDCPLTDPSIIDYIVNESLAASVDYASNTLKPTWPDGLDAEIIRFDSLQVARENAKLPSEREHVTPYFYNHPERFKLKSIENNNDLSSLRWCVDEPEDFEFVQWVYKHLYENYPAFDMCDILKLTSDNPNVFFRNSSFKRNEGYDKSLKNE